MTLSAVEFLRRFLMHVLPKGFVRIRHYGFLANRHRKEKLNLCRRLLAAPTAPTESCKRDAAAPKCPACGERSLRIVMRFEQGERPPHARSATLNDTS